MKFQKEWLKSGIKAWPYALLDLISFIFILQAINIDYNQLGFTQLAYSVALIFLTYLSSIFNQLFFEQVIKDMKSKGFLGGK